MSLRLTAPDALRELNILFYNWARIDQDHVKDVEIVASGAHLVATVSASINWLEISPDGGANYYAIPTDKLNGYDLLAFSDGERKAYKIRLHIPIATDFRQGPIPLFFGTGV